MEISIKIIFPMTLIHTITLTPYFIFSAISLQKSFYDEPSEFIIYSEYTMIVSFDWRFKEKGTFKAKALYSAIVPLSVCILQRLTRTRKVVDEWKRPINQADEYFIMFQRQLECAPRRV